MRNFYANEPYYLILFFLWLLMSNFTILNTLTGVMVEVVRDVQEVESEKALVAESTRAHTYHFRKEVLFQVQKSV